ncbi:MAG: sulfatase-like hydrolase/transferase, partial [Geodermatophilaceae bacterium]
NNPLCCPGRASILTGQVDTRTGVQNNAQAANLRPEETVGVAMHDAGYRTGLFGKLLNGFGEESGTWPGWDDFQPIVSRNIYAQYNYQVLNNGVAETYGDAPQDYQVDVITDKALDFIQDTPASEPLFLYVAPTAAHTPFIAAPRHQNAYIDEPIRLPANFGEADVSDKPTWVQELEVPGRGGAVSQRRKQYAAGLGVDDMVRSIDGALANTGRLENTVLIFLSDNGLSVGSNRWSSKMCELRGCAALPMMVRYPGVPGRDDERLVSTIDIAPTVVDLGDATLPVTPDGTSLVPAISDPTGTVPTHDALLEHWPGGNQSGGYATGSYPTPGFYAIRTARWRYAEVTNLDAPGKTEYELYDEIADPGELQNRASDRTLADVRADLQEQMYDLIRATGATPGVPQGSWRPQSSAPPTGLTFFLRNSNSPGPADLSVPYGSSADIPLTCDWDGDGKDTVGVFRAGTFSLRNSNSAGNPNRQFTFGQAGDIPICGDWNGNGVDTIGVYRGNEFYLRNSNSSGPSNIHSSFGTAGDIPVVGDWNGDDKASIGVFRSGMWYLSDRNSSPFATYGFSFGTIGDAPTIGDWTGRGSDAVGVRRASNVYLRYSLAAGPADLSVGYGIASDRAVAGNWDGLAGDSVGVTRR